MSFSEAQIYSHTLNGRWVGGWPQIRLLILKFSYFEIRLSSMNGGSITKCQSKKQLEEIFLKNIYVRGKTTRHSIGIMMLA